MYPGTYAAEAPDRAAVVMADTGETLSYGDLERRSVQLAHVLHEAGLRPGDVVAHIVNDSGATALIVSAEQAAAAEAITGLTTGVKLRLSFGGPAAGHDSY